jgi:hypothetical protein
VNSLVVNKLIRSEVWPILRAQGFSKFNSRNAWRYRGPWIDVVNFQSFNAYLAEGLGCTTFSFKVNLAVFVTGAEQDDWIPRDAAGRLLPQEYHCFFRAYLEKRTAVDGFKRLNIFHIDSQGNTTAAAFGEAQALLRESAPRWFGAFENLGATIDRMSSDIPTPAATEGIVDTMIASRGSPAWNNLMAGLRVLAHTETGTAESALVSLHSVDVAVGSILNTYTVYGPPDIEAQARRIRHLLSALTSWLPAVETRPSVLVERSRLMGLTWSHTPMGGAAAAGVEPVRPRDRLWPLLRTQGFAEFSERLAHRPSRDSVQVVAIVPVGRNEPKDRAQPPGRFRIGIGVFWPALADGQVRRNRRGQARPTLNECQVQMWLTPDHPDTTSPTLFAGAPDALAALATDGAAWLDLCAKAETLIRLFDDPDWRIFANYPAMRGFGAVDSVPRSLLKAALARQLGDSGSVRAHLEAAGNAIDSHPEFRRDYFRGRVHQVAVNLEK